MTFIDPRAKVLRHLDRLVGWQRGETPAPVTVEWDLSNRCTLGCQDCHFAHTHTRGPWTAKPRTLPMAFESTGDLADVGGLVWRVLAELADAGVQAVIWSGGGEPTTHPRWQDAVAYGYRVGLQQGMYTLGGLLTRESARSLARNVEWVVVSLDAADAETYSAEKGVPQERFGAALNGIRWLVEAQQTVVGVSFLLHAQNYTRAWNMLALARSLGATYTTFRPAIRVDQANPSVTSDDRRWITTASEFLGTLSREQDVEIDPRRFYEYAKWQAHGYTSCTGIRLNTTITPDGRVWVCPQRRGVADSCLGDLRRESFATIWARHPGRFTVDDGCRVMCRLHPVNQTLAALEQPMAHEAFV